MPSAVDVWMCGCVDVLCCAFLGHDILGDLENWAVGWTDWNIVLNPQGGPNHVSNFCNAPIIADSNAQTLTYQPAYWYLGHFSRFLPPGSVRLQTTVSGSGAADVQATTFVQPDVWMLSVLVLVL